MSPTKITNLPAKNPTSTKVRAKEEVKVEEVPEAKKKVVSPPQAQTEVANKGNTKKKEVLKEANANEGNGGQNAQSNTKTSTTSKQSANAKAQVKEEAKGHEEEDDGSGSTNEDGANDGGSKTEGQS